MANFTKFGAGLIQEDLNTETVKTRMVKSVLLLYFRTFIMQIITFVSTVIILPTLLQPSQYGTFIITSAIINFFSYFSDIGLAAGLVQKKERLTEDDLKTTFTIQQSLIIVLVLVIFLISPLLKNWYNLSDEAIYLLYALAVSLIFSSLKTIPSVLLEREVDFNKLVIPQIVETVLFYLSVTILAYYGFGVTSFTVAVLLRGISGFIILYILRPWLPGFAFSKASLKNLIKFGIPYQINTLLAVLKDDGMTAFLGIILGASGMGLLGWAQKWANAPLRFFMDQVIKVTFPALSRLQDNKQELSRIVSRTLFFISLLTFPSIIILIVTAPVLTEIVPKYHNWKPALVALSILSINTFWAAITTPLTNMLNAVGKIGKTFQFMVMWTVLTWVLVPALSYYMGINGAAIGFALVGTSSVIVLIYSFKNIRIDLSSIVKPLCAALLMGAAMVLARQQIVANLTSVFIIVTVGISAYILSLYFIVGPSLIIDFRKIFSVVVIKAKLKI